MNQHIKSFKEGTEEQTLGKYKIKGQLVQSINIYQNKISKKNQLNHDKRIIYKGHKTIVNIYVSNNLTSE